MRRRKKTKVKIPNDREIRMVKDVHKDAEHMYDLLANLDGPQEIKDELAEGIGEFEDLCEALLTQGSVPQVLRHPSWNKVMN